MVLSKGLIGLDKTLTSKYLISYGVVEIMHSKDVSHLNELVATVNCTLSTIWYDMTLCSTMLFV